MRFEPSYRGANPAYNEWADERNLYRMLHDAIMYIAFRHKHDGGKLTSPRDLARHHHLSSNPDRARLFPRFLEELPSWGCDYIYVAKRSRKGEPLYAPTAAGEKYIEGVEWTVEVVRKQHLRRAERNNF